MPNVAFAIMTPLHWNTYFMALFHEPLDRFEWIYTLWYYWSNTVIHKPECKNPIHAKNNSICLFYTVALNNKVEKKIASQVGTKAFF